MVNRSFSGPHLPHPSTSFSAHPHERTALSPVPEWHDTLILPAAQPQPGTDSQDINQATFGAMTFRTRWTPDTVGSFVMHSHILTHEDIGMMQRLDCTGGYTPGARQPLKDAVFSGGDWY